MDLFGILRVSIQVTWLPRRKAAARQPAATADGDPDSPPVSAPVDTAESVIPRAAVPPPLAPGPPEPLPVLVPSAVPADQEQVLHSLISLADDLAGLTGHAAEDGMANRSLRLAQWRVAQVLAECGVQTVADEGPVDPARHEVVGSRPAAHGGTAGWIAATVRRGYLADGQLIRPQQVVAYTANTAPSEEGTR